MTAIVIPAADVAETSEALLTDLLDSIVKHNIQEEMPVVVCFDGCHDKFVEHFILKYSFITSIVNSGNRSNFAGNANRWS